MTGRAGTNDEHPGPKYAVDVEGGKGAVIGDYATVFQMFAAAPPALSQFIRTSQFSALVDERTRNFVGRDFILTAINACLSDPEFPSGYVIVQGEPGIGKTAVLSQVVKTQGYVHHFNVAPLGIRSPEAFLSNVCAQLVVRFGLDHRSLPPEATQDGGYLARLLSEAASDRANRPLVVVVDALDEAEDVGLSSGANRLFLPAALPERVYFVVSTRPRRDYHLSVDRRRDIYIRDDDPQNLEDVRTFIRGHIDLNRAQMMARLAAAGISEEQFIDVLNAKSEGNFMYLVHVLRDIRSGELEVGGTGDISALPQGLGDYYRRHWNAMKSADQERFRRYQQPVVCLLATAREPVGMVHVVEWTAKFWTNRGWDAQALDPLGVKDVLDAWREFLDQRTVDGERRYSIYHASFQDFLAEEVGLVAFHETIGQTALAKVRGFPAAG